MRTDLVRIWQNEKKTILFVTHDIEEAIQLADRVLVMSPRPATIQEVVDVELSRPARPRFARLSGETRPHLPSHGDEPACRRSKRGCLTRSAGAGSRIRTDDLLITNQLLYQLSYAGKEDRAV
jgi:ABC-type proline/glycine betaine transport system ATPase subunit